MAETQTTPLQPEDFHFEIQGVKFKIEFEFALSANVHQWLDGPGLNYWEYIGGVDVEKQDVPQAIRDCMGHAFDKLAEEHREALRDGETVAWVDWVGAPVEEPDDNDCQGHESLDGITFEADCDGSCR